MQTVNATPVSGKSNAAVVIATGAAAAAAAAAAVVIPTLAFALFHKISEKVGLI